MRHRQETHWAGEGWVSGWGNRDGRVGCPGQPWHNADGSLSGSDMTWSAQGPAPSRPPPRIPLRWFSSLTDVQWQAPPGRRAGEHAPGEHTAAPSQKSSALLLILLILKEWSGQISPLTTPKHTNAFNCSLACMTQFQTFPSGQTTIMWAITRDAYPEAVYKQTEVLPHPVTVVSQCTVSRKMCVNSNQAPVEPL